MQLVLCVGVEGPRLGGRSEAEEEVHGCSEAFGAENL